MLITQMNTVNPHCLLNILYRKTYLVSRPFLWCYTPPASAILNGNADSHYLRVSASWGLCVENGWDQRCLPPLLQERMNDYVDCLGVHMLPFLGKPYIFILTFGKKSRYCGIYAFFPAPNHRWGYIYARISPSLPFSLFFSHFSFPNLVKE